MILDKILFIPLRQNLHEAGRADPVNLLEVAEGSAVPTRLEPDQRVGHWQDAEEQHRQQ